MAMTLELCVACCYDCGDVEMAQALEAAIKERGELRAANEFNRIIASSAVARMVKAESELAALKQRIAIGRYVRSTRNGVIRTPVGWCKPNTDYTIITDANPPME